MDVILYFLLGMLLAFIPATRYYKRKLEREQNELVARIVKSLNREVV